MAYVDREQEYHSATILFSRAALDVDMRLSYAPASSDIYKIHVVQNHALHDLTTSLNIYIRRLPPYLHTYLPTYLPIFLTNFLDPYRQRRISYVLFCSHKNHTDNSSPFLFLKHLSYFTKIIPISFSSFYLNNT